MWWGHRDEKGDIHKKKIKKYIDENKSREKKNTTWTIAFVLSYHVFKDNLFDVRFCLFHALNILFHNVNFSLLSHFST